MSWLGYYFVAGRFRRGGPNTGCRPGRIDAIRVRNPDADCADPVETPSHRNPFPVSGNGLHRPGCNLSRVPAHRVLIITADDYGYSPRYDEGIVEAAGAGAVDSVSVMVTRE